MIEQQEAQLKVPKPRADADSSFFWEGLRERRLMLQRCTACQRYRFPAMPACPYCASPTFDVIEASGRGSVYSWIVVRRAFDPAFAGEVPYTLATVELAEGPRTVARLEGADAVSFDLEVRAEFFEHADWTELRFKPFATAE